MINKPLSVVIIFVLILLLSSCNLPSRQAIGSSTPGAASIFQGTPTPSSLCTNSYYPDALGDKWEYSGTNSIVGGYTRTDTISAANAESFSVESTSANVSYTVPYDCSPTGLTSRDPIQQYAGLLLNSPGIPVNLILRSNTGTSLPTMINPGDSWQQTAEWEASSQRVNVNGRFVFNYTAVGYENVAVTAGTYNALRVDANIRIEVTGFHVLAGTYTVSTWYAPEVGMVKSEGASHITGFDFSDSMQLTSYTPGS